LLNGELTTGVPAIEGLQGVPGGHRVVLAVEQEEVAQDHGFEWVTSPAGVHVVPYSMPAGPYWGVSSELTSSLFGLLFKGLSNFHGPDYTYKKHPDKLPGQHNSTPLRLFRVFLEKYFVYHKNELRAIFVRFWFR
jgi:hypothetical protein